MEELQAAMTNMVKLQIKQQKGQQSAEELHEKWEKNKNYY